jgi:F0F1-type ATP synthase membrane subunit b/b'
MSRTKHVLTEPARVAIEAARVEIETQINLAKSAVAHHAKKLAEAEAELADLRIERAQLVDPFAGTEDGDVT